MSNDANALVALFESLTGDELTWLAKRVVSRNVARRLPQVPPELASFAAEILCEHERHYEAVRQILRRGARACSEARRAGETGIIQHRRKRSIAGFWHFFDSTTGCVQSS